MCPFMAADISIERFDRVHLPDEQVLQQAIDLFIRNYPPMHDPEDRAGAISAHESVEMLKLLIGDLEALYLALDTHQKVCGLLESKRAEMEEGIYAIVAWIMVDASVQGRGISSQLHRRFEEDVARLRGETQKPVTQLLSVHEDNKAREIYEKWGYRVEPFLEHPKPRKIFMFKD